MKLRLLPLLCLPLAAFAQNLAEPIVYACDNGSRIEISRVTDDDGRPLAVLHFGDQTLTLPQVPAAAGALYRNQGIRLHLRDDQVRFEDGAGNTRHCRPGDSGPPAATANRAPVATGSFIDLSGSVAWPGGAALAADAVLIVRVRDTAPGAGRTLAEQRIALAGLASPVPFATSVDRDLIGKKARLAISARIEQAGHALFVSRQDYPALDQGEARPQAIELRPVGRRRL